MKTKLPVLFSDTLRLSCSMLAVIAAVEIAPSAFAAQDLTIQNETYGSGQTETVIATATVTANTNVTVSSGANITYVAGTRVTLGPGFRANSGSTFRALVGDGDGDGMPDGWEILTWGNTAQTGTGNPDGDTLNNLTEFLLGTDPTASTPATAPSSTVTVHRPSP